MTLPGELGGVGFPPLCGRLSGFARGSLFLLSCGMMMGRKSEKV